MAKHTIDELYQMQALPLDLKIRLTQDRIRGWVNTYDSYISFSGGKDSTVLLHLVRQLYPETPAVFIDTGLEYPEIREFVKTFDNVTWLKPSMNFRKVIEKYGYPFKGRFERMKITHPKQYEWIMKPWDAGGLGYKSVIDWINENGNLHIRY